jgi:hypothetical protein
VVAAALEADCTTLWQRSLRESSELRNHDPLLGRYIRYSIPQSVRHSLSKN